MPRLTPLLLSRISTFIIFLAMIRCIAEPLRLQYYSETTLSMDIIRPFIVGALVAAGGLLLMTILTMLQYYKSVTAAAILSIAGLVLVKLSYGL